MKLDARVTPVVGDYLQVIAPILLILFQKSFCHHKHKKIMASEKKKRKTDKRLHLGRVKNFMKLVGKWIKCLCYYTPSQRQVDKKIDLDSETAVPYQLCPKCGGDCTVMVQNTNGGTSISSSLQTCNLCGGSMIIPRVTNRYFHELEQTEIETLIADKKTCGYIMVNYKQPDWCKHTEALSMNIGCWSLCDLSKDGLRTKISKDFCKGCDCFYL